MTPSIARKALQLLRKPMEQASLEEQEKMELSTRETEVLEQLATGKSYTKIAEILVISPATVRKHIENIYKNYRLIISWRLSRLPEEINCCNS